MYAWANEASAYNHHEENTGRQTISTPSICPSNTHHRESNNPPPSVCPSNTHHRESNNPPSSVHPTWHISEESFEFLYRYVVIKLYHNTYRIHCSIDSVTWAAFYAYPNIMTNMSSDLETVDVSWITWVNCSFRMKAISSCPTQVGVWHMT